MLSKIKNFLKFEKLKKWQRILIWCSMGIILITAIALGCYFCGTETFLGIISKIGSILAIFL